MRHPRRRQCLHLLIPVGTELAGFCNASIKWIHFGDFKEARRSRRKAVLRPALETH